MPGSDVIESRHEPSCARIEWLVRTKGRDQLIDLTDPLRTLIRSCGMDNGMVLISVPHTTCGLTVNEHADPDVAHDLLFALDRMVPWEQGFSHAEGNSAAHVKASLMGSALTLPVTDHNVSLGRWQGVFLCEFDGPRKRTVRIDLHATNGASLD